MAKTAALRMRTLVAAYLGIFLNMAALFMALPSWQEWLIVRSCADLSSAAAAASSMSPSSNATTTYDCGAHDAEVSSVAGNHYARLLFANTFVSFLTSGALSSVSDFVGRRGVLILCAATGVVLYVGWVGVVYFNLALAWFIPFHIVAGLGGGMATAIAVTISIIADTTTSAQRSLYVAAVLGIVYVSGMVGPLLGGYVTQYCPGGYLATFSIALGLQLGQLCVVVCILPESLPSTKRLPRPPLSLRTAAQFYFGPVSFVFTSSVSLALISALYALQYVVLCGTFSLLVLYVKMSKFDFTAEEVGHILTINYAAKSASVFLCIPIITGMWRCFSARSSSSGGEGGEKEIAVGGLLLVARIGFFIAAVMYVGYAVASNLLLMFVCAAIEGFDTMWESAVHGITSHIVVSQHQGRAFGGLAFLRSLVNCAAPFLVNTVWGWTVASDPTLIFYIMSCLSIASLLLTVPLGCALRRELAKPEMIAVTTTAYEYAAAGAGGGGGDENGAMLDDDDWRTSFAAAAEEALLESAPDR